MNQRDFLLPVPANPPDAGTAYYVEFGADWIPSILWALDNLRDETIWLSPPSDIIPQIDELIARFQNPLIVGTQIFPAQVTHFHFNSVVDHGNPIAFAVVANDEFGGKWRQNTAALDDEFHFVVPLKAGNCAVVVRANTTTTCGIMTFTTDEGNTCTIDLYSAALVHDNVLSATLTIVAEGNHQINVKMHTKNALATSYICQLTTIQFNHF